MGKKEVKMGINKKLLLPSEISAEEAIKLGLLMPSREIDGKVIPATPAGMGVFAKTGIQIKNADGSIASFKHPVTGKMVEQLESPCHSFTRQFGLWVRNMFSNAGSSLNVNETLTDDTGATFLTRIKGGSLSSNVACVTGLAKIKFGNSSAALSTTQTNLQGTLLGPTTEAAVTVTLTIEDSTNTIFTTVGQITNGTGGTFTVQEMGLFSELNDSTAGTNRTTMMLRDLTGAVVVNNGQTIIGTWTFTVAV